MAQKFQNGFGIGGELTVIFIAATTGGLLWTFWDQMPEWLRVVLLIFCTMTIVFGTIIAAGIDADRRK